MTSRRLVSALLACSTFLGLHCAGATGGGTSSSGSSSSGGEIDSGGSSGGPSDASTEDVGTRSDAGGAKRIAFVTSAKFGGNLTSGGGAVDGLAAGDAICTKAAATAKLGGTWHAWLSSSNVDAIDRLPGSGPWYSTRGNLLFASKASIADLPQGPIDGDELGNAVKGTVWTGTRATGLRAPRTCSDWTSNNVDKLGLTGYGGGRENWTDFSDSNHPCNQPYSLYCFQD